jgi:hypothetical protein
MASPSKQGLTARARVGFQIPSEQGIIRELRLGIAQRERAVMDELLRMEEAGEVRQNPDTGQTTELGRQGAFEQTKEDYGVLAHSFVCSIE